MTPPLGAAVAFTWTLHRRSAWNAQGRLSKAWVVGEWVGQAEPAARRGILVGVRTLANGTVEYLGHEEGSVFRPEERLTAYLVAYDLRRQPVFVLPEHLVVAE